MFRINQSACLIMGVVFKFQIMSIHCIKAFLGQH